MIPKYIEAYRAWWVSLHKAPGARSARLALKAHCRANSSTSQFPHVWALVTKAGK